MARKDFTTLYSPANGLPWECPNKSVEAHLKRGWTKNPNKQTPKDERNPSPTVVSNV